MSPLDWPRIASALAPSATPSPEPRPVVLVLAPQRSWAQLALRDVNPARWRYIGHEHMLRGYQRGTPYLVLHPEALPLSMWHWARTAEACGYTQVSLTDLEPDR